MSQPATTVDDVEAATIRRCRDLRESLGYSQQRWADALGVAFSQVGNLEALRNPLRLYVGLAICRTANVSPFWLATGEGQKTGFDPGAIEVGEEVTIRDRRLFSSVFGNENAAEKAGQFSVSVDYVPEFNLQTESLVLKRPEARVRTRFIGVKGEDSDWQMLLACLPEADHPRLEQLTTGSLARLVEAARSLCVG